MSETNVMYIGKKPVYSYAVAGLIKLNDGLSTLSIRARGNSIPRAVDVAEFIRNRFMSNLAINSISIGTDTLPSQAGEMRNVSTIEITLAKEMPATSEPNGPSKPEAVKIPRTRSRAKPARRSRKD